MGEVGTVSIGTVRVRVKTMTNLVLLLGIRSRADFKKAGGGEKKKEIRRSRERGHVIKISKLAS